MVRVILISALMGISGHGYALDLDSLKSKLNKYVDIVKEKLGSDKKSDSNTFEMPPIPRIKKDATDVDFYKKSGKIYTQGLSFKKLSVDMKRNYYVSFVEELYLVVRGATATTDEVVRGVNILEQGGTREGVYRSLVFSQEYRALEAYEEVPNEKLMSFTFNFAEKYFSIRYNKNELKRLNLWGLKRVLVEKSLEIVDAFPTDGENLYRWYAIMSSELAKVNGGRFKGKIRLQTNEKAHYRWAQKVPLQQIKSEIIIKIHKVMNSLK